MKPEEITSKVAELTTWWIKQRAKKIDQSEHGTMEVNPFLAPLIAALHGLGNARELANFITAGHFYIGHSTGFGKLIDEKILPQAFGTRKLDKKFRANSRYAHHAFDDIDHIVTRPDGVYLLSQKASRWTIQLGQAAGLNRSFKTLLELREAGEVDFKKIVVGVFYGNDDELTEKYRILRGIVTGAEHDVVLIADDVEVYAGKSFWAWLAGDARAQDWVMTGILRAIAAARVAEATAEDAAEKIERELSGILAKIGDINTEESWSALLNLTNR